MSIRYSQPGVA
jgi:hypothetical protein